MSKTVATYTMVIKVWSDSDSLSAERDYCACEADSPWAIVRGESPQAALGALIYEQHRCNRLKSPLSIEIQADESSQARLGFH